MKGILMHFSSNEKRKATKITERKATFSFRGKMEMKINKKKEKNFFARDEMKKYLQRMPE
jgi:hypothetical protein